MGGKDSIPTAQVGEIKRGVCGVGGGGGQYGAFGDEFGERVELQSRPNSQDDQACSGPRPSPSESLSSPSRCRAVVLLPCLISNSKGARGGGASLTDALRASKGEEVFVLPLQDARSVRWSVHYQNSTPFSPQRQQNSAEKNKISQFL